MDIGILQYAVAVLITFLSVTLSNLPAVDGACQENGRQHVLDADVTFALMLQLRNPETGQPNSCHLSAVALQHYLAVEWLVDKINAYNQTGYIPGLKIGYTSYDDCGETMYSARNSISFLNSTLAYMASTCSADVADAPQIGVIGPSSSQAAQTVASLIQDHPMPIISPRATTTELSNKTLYPTFLRTVPSDVQQMNLVVDVLKQLEWTYIAVAYQNDEYGRSGRHILMEKAKEHGICIHQEHFALPGDDGDLGSSFENILEGAEGKSLAVVIIAKSTVAKNLLYALEMRISRNYRRGLHFILLDTVNTDVSVFKSQEQAQGTISISLGKGNLDTSRLKTELNEKYQQLSQGNSHGLVREYLEEFPNAGPLIPGSVDAFLPATINAVLALVHGLKSLHKDTCGYGLCEPLKEKIKSGKLLNYVKGAKVDYTSIPSSILPVTSDTTKFSFSFDENGDFQIDKPTPLYTLFSYDENNYKQVGSYTNGITHLDESSIKWLSPQGEAMSGVPTSMCAGDGCSYCQNDGFIPITLLEGDVYIVGVFPLHETDPKDPFKCSTFRSISHDAIALEGFLFAVQKLQTLTGIRFGALAIDSCYSKLRMMNVLSNIFSDLSSLSSKMFRHVVPIKKVVGVIGCMSSGCTIPTATFFTPLNIPMVSYASSSPDLDDRIDFPYFLRTVPSDVYQAQVMVNIIRKMGWEYVGLMYVNNNYGAKGMKAFRDIVDADGSGICAAKEIPISDKETVDDADLFNARRMLTAQDVKVVVFFGIDIRFTHFIQNLEEDKRYGSFIFLASEEWGVNENIKNAGVKACSGSITLKLKTMDLEWEEEFKSHLRNRVPSDKDSNVWFGELWQNLFKCRFRGGFYDQFNRECSTNQRLTEGQIRDGVADQRTRHVLNAVFALGKGLKEVNDRYCKAGFESCDFLRINPQGVLDEIKKQTRREGSVRVQLFDEDGNGAIGFDVFNIQYNGSSYEYEKVGTFGPRTDELKVDKLKFYDKYQQEMSTYTASCHEDLCAKCRHRAKPVTPVEEEEERVLSVSDYRSSDILLISLVVVVILAIAVLVVAFVICFRRKYRVIEKKLERTEEQIYDEPIRQVYPGHNVRPGANLPFSDPNISPYVLNGMITRDGVANPTFLSDSDRIESVSQIIANRAMSEHTPNSTFGVGEFTRQSSAVSQGQTVQLSNQANQMLSYKNIGLENMNPVGSEYNNSTSQPDNSVVYTPVAVSSVPLNMAGLSSPQSAPSAADSGVIIGKTPDGQLVAYMPQGNGQPAAPNLRPFSTQDSINPTYGPYSLTAALQRQQIAVSTTDQNGYNPQQTSETSGRQFYDIPPSTVILNPPQTGYQNIGLHNLDQARNINMNNPGQREPPTMNQNFPVQYTIPTQMISAPNDFSTNIPNFHPNMNTQTSHTGNYSEGIPNRQNPGGMNPSNQSLRMTRAVNQTNPQETSSDDNWQDEENDVNAQQRLEGQRAYGYPDSNSLSSIPDVISGKMPYTPASPQRIPRDISLESIDLNTNTDTGMVQEIQFTPKKQPINVQNVQKDTTSKDSVVSVV